MEVCYACNREPAARYITCSAHKDRRMVCPACFDDRDPGIRDGCDVSGCHGRVHAVRRSRALRSLDYFRQRGTEAVAVILGVGLFMIVLMGLLILVFLPYLPLMHEDKDHFTVFHGTSTLCGVFYFTQISVYSICCMFIWIFTGIEWAERKHSVIRDTFRRHSIYHMSAAVYAAELAFGALLFFAPDWAPLLLRISWVGFLALDAFFLLLLRRIIWALCCATAAGVRDWFTEDREDHFFSADAPS